ncbi:MAG: peptide chain release factor 3, partial [Gammaproteobacteria bacterium]
GIPDFAPELFRRAVLGDPLRLKALNKGLDQLCEEGATQLFRPLLSNDLILGAIGPLQFEVASFRLRDEYGVECVFEAVNVVTARWIHCADERMLDEFSRKLQSSLALDHTGQLVFLATSSVKLNLTQERWPDIEFQATREHGRTARAAS